MKYHGRMVSLLAAICAMSLMVMTGCDDSDDDTDTSSDSSMIVGTWKVISSWRWSQVTFNSSGTVDTVQKSDGKVFTNKATWYLSDGKLVIVSDITEACTYTVTATTLAITFPNSTTTISMTKVN